MRVLCGAPAVERHVGKHMFLSHLPSRVAVVSVCRTPPPIDEARRIDAAALCDAGPSSVVTDMARIPPFTGADPAPCVCPPPQPTLSTLSVVAPWVRSTRALLPLVVRAPFFWRGGADKTRLSSGPPPDPPPPRFRSSPSGSRLLLAPLPIAEWEFQQGGGREPGVWSAPLRHVARRSAALLTSCWSAESPRDDATRRPNFQQLSESALPPSDRAQYKPISLFRS